MASRVDRYCFGTLRPWFHVFVGVVAMRNIRTAGYVGKATLTGTAQGECVPEAGGTLAVAAVGRSPLAAGLTPRRGPEVLLPSSGARFVFALT